MYVVQYFSPRPSVEPNSSVEPCPSMEHSPSMEDMEDRVRQKYIAEVQSRPATLKKIHLYKGAKKWRALLILVLCLHWEIHSKLRFALSVCSCQANCILSVFLLLLNPAHSRDHYIALTNSCQGKKCSWSWFWVLTLFYFQGGIPVSYWIRRKLQKV